MKFFIGIKYLQYEGGFFIKSIRHQIVSVALVAENGNTFYMASNDFCGRHASDWERKNVIGRLDENMPFSDISELKESITRFINFHAKFDKIEFIGYQCPVETMLLSNILSWPNTISVPDLNAVEYVHASSLTTEELVSDVYEHTVYDDNEEIDKQKTFKTHVLYPTLTSNATAIEKALFTHRLYTMMEDLDIISTPKQIVQND